MVEEVYYSLRPTHAEGGPMRTKGAGFMGPPPKAM